MQYNNCFRSNGFSLGADGYTFTYVDGSKIRGHRYILQAKLGRPIRDGMVAYHICGNRWCLNPDHIMEGTHAERARVGVIARRAAGMPRAAGAYPYMRSMRMALESQYVYYRDGRTHCLISRDIL